MKSFVPVYIPPEHRERALHRISILNQRLMVGNWEMDNNDGEVLFRITVVLGQPLAYRLPDLVHPLLTAAIQRSVLTMTKYLPTWHA